MIKAALMGLAALLTVPFVILAWTTPFICLVWLAVLHDWHLIILGVIIGFVAPYIISMVMGGLAMLFAATAKNLLPAKIASIIVSVFAFALLTTFCLLVFSYGLAAGQGRNIVPYALWGYATSVWPYQSSAEKSRGDPYAVVWTSAASFGGLATLIFILTGHTMGLLWPFVPSALFGLWLGFAIASDD